MHASRKLIVTVLGFCLINTISCRTVPPTTSAPKVYLGDIGSEVKDEKDPVFKSTVALLVKTKKDEWMAFCTGTIIDPHYVLTASHCIKQCIGDCSWALGYGYDPTQNKITPVEAIAKSPLYSVSDINDTYKDFALLYVKEPLANPPHAVAPLSSTAHTSPKDHLVQAGYGFSTKEENSDGASGKLGKVADGYFEESDRIEVLNVANPTLASIRAGDSGGPLYKVEANGTYSLQGLVNMGGVATDATGKETYSSVYNNAPLLTNWIEALSSRQPFPLTVKLPVIKEASVFEEAITQRMIAAKDWRKYLQTECELKEGYGLKKDASNETIMVEDCEIVTAKACEAESKSDDRTEYWSSSKDACVDTPDSKAECEQIKEAKTKWDEADSRCTVIFE